MNLKRILGALAVAAAPAFGHADPVDLSSGSAGFFNTPVGGGFMDSYTFALVTPGIISASITSAVGGSQNVDFSSIALIGPSGTFTAAPVLADPFETYGLTTGLLGAGSYALTLTGSNSAARGSYGGNIAFSATSGTGLAPSTVSGVAGLGSLDLSSGSAGFANTPIAGVFLDTLSFTLAARSSFTGSVSSAVGGAQDVDFTSITIVGPSGSFGLTNAVGDPYETWVLPSVELNPGTYTAQFVGMNSAAIGSYGGNFAVAPLGSGGTPTPVPEPSTAVLALTALGVLRWVRFQRS